MAARKFNVGNHVHIRKTGVVGVVKHINSYEYGWYSMRAFYEVWTTDRKTYIGSFKSSDLDHHLQKMLTYEEMI
jgi:hypothetical protein